MATPTDPNPTPLPRLFCRFIKAHHHLSKVQTSTGNEVQPQRLYKTSRFIQDLIRPAFPNPQTSLLAAGNSRNWYHTSLQILEDHYMAEIQSLKQLILANRETDWLLVWEQAVTWSTFDLRGLQDSINAPQIGRASCRERV